MNKSNAVKYIVYALIGLAVFGLIWQAFTKPGEILKSIFLFAIVAGVIYVVYNIILNKKNANYSSYNKAAKQANKKYGNQNMKYKGTAKKTGNSIKTKVAVSPLKRKRKSADHLTVIEGKKGKKKDRRTM